MSNLEHIAEFKKEGMSFTQLPLVKKAQDDFRFIATRSNFMVTTNLGLQSIVKDGNRLADVLVVPFSVEEKSTTFPANLVKTDDSKMCVGIVCYSDGNPVDVLMFNSSNFAKPKKFVKYDKKNQQFIIKIKDIKHKSAQKHAFGVFINQI